MCGKTRHDRIRIGNIRERIGVAPIVGLGGLGM